MIEWAKPLQGPARPRQHSDAATGPIVVGAAVAGLTLVVFQWVLFVAGIPFRIHSPSGALFVAQSVLNGGVCGYLFGNRCGAIVSREARRQVSVVRWVALFALSSVLPLVYEWNTGGKASEGVIVLAVGGVMGATILAVVVAPMLYALAARRRENPQIFP